MEMNVTDNENKDNENNLMDLDSMPSSEEKQDTLPQSAESMTTSAENLLKEEQTDRKSVV